MVKLCDEIDSPVPFHCRRGNCGTCRIEVLEGVDELLPAETQERNVLDMLGLSPPKHRLACQAQMRLGLDVLHVSPLGRRPPPSCALWVPVAHNIETNEYRVCRSDTGAADITITGAAELKVGSIILMTFKSAIESKPNSIVGRILRVTPSDEVTADPRSYMTAIELLENNEFLASLFEPVF